MPVHPRHHDRKPLQHNLRYLTAQPGLRGRRRPDEIRYVWYFLGAPARHCHCKAVRVGVVL
jgi:rhamnopyranosyl-N-acetylglucosaminyl-diphospho-decaprenol beta-1,3/1,4-galactofuranosyltransferase